MEGKDGGYIQIIKPHLTLSQSRLLGSPRGQSDLQPQDIVSNIKAGSVL